MSNRTEDMETNFEVRSFDAEITKEAYDRLSKLPLYFILDSLRSAFNVGSIFRTCDILRVKGLFLCGYTACPPHAKLEKTALGTVDYVPWWYFESAGDAVAYLQDQGIAVWAAETTSGSVPYAEALFPDELAIVLGNEALGVSHDVLDRCRVPRGVTRIPSTWRPPAPSSDSRRWREWGEPEVIRRNENENWSGRMKPRDRYGSLDQIFLPTKNGPSESMYNAVCWVFRMSWTTRESG